MSNIIYSRIAQSIKWTWWALKVHGTAPLGVSNNLFRVAETEKMSIIITSLRSQHTKRTKFEILNTESSSIENISINEGENLKSREYDGETR